MNRIPKEADGGEGAARTERLLAAVAAGELARPAVGRNLDAVRAGRAALAPRLAERANGAIPAWWDGERDGLALAGAALEGASLVAADLAGANLRGARLAGAVGRAVRLDGAVLEEADLSRADMIGASFADSAAGEAVFADAMLEDADFARARMRFARLPRALLDGASFADADLWGADLSGADADRTRFRGARLTEANLADVNLTYADFEGADLSRARLTGSRLRGAVLTGAKLDGADLSGADLSEASLVRLNLTACRLDGARFAGAWLSGTRLRVEQLGGAVGEEVAGEYDLARASYLALEQNFESLGSRDEASWAYKRRRRMGRLHAGARTRAAWRARDPRALLRDGYRWGTDLFVEGLCDYGESLSRIAGSFVLLTVAFGVLYGISGGLILPDTNEPTRNILDLFTYSALNIMTANPPDIGFKVVGRITNLLVGIEGGLGIILMGLFGFVLGNRLRR